MAPLLLFSGFGPGKGEWEKLEPARERTGEKWEKIGVVGEGRRNRILMGGCLGEDVGGEGYVLMVVQREKELWSAAGEKIKTSGGRFGLFSWPRGLVLKNPRQKWGGCVWIFREGAAVYERV